MWLCESSVIDTHGRLLFVTASEHIFKGKNQTLNIRQMLHATHP